MKKENREIIEFHNVGNDEMPVFEALSEKNQQAYEAFKKKWKVPQIIISEAYQKFGADEFYKIYLNVEKAIANGKIKNKGAYAATCLRGGYTYEGEDKDKDKIITEIKQNNQNDILETQRIEEKIKNLTEEEKDEIAKILNEKYKNNPIIITYVQNKSFDEINQNFYGKKLINEFIKNSK